MAARSWNGPTRPAFRVRSSSTLEIFDSLWPRLTLDDGTTVDHNQNLIAASSGRSVDFTLASGAEGKFRTFFVVPKDAKPKSAAKDPDALQPGQTESPYGPTNDERSTMATHVPTPADLNLTPKKVATGSMLAAAMPAVARTIARASRSRGKTSEMEGSIRSIVASALSSG